MSHKRPIRRLLDGVLPREGASPKNAWAAFLTAPALSILARVSLRTHPKKPANLRSWRVIIMRSRGEYLGSVEAPDRERAEAIAIKQFALDQDQRRRLLIRERP